MIVRDVTSHKQATLDLEKSNRFFQKLAKTMPGVLFVYDLIEKRILYVNPGGWELLGYTEDDFLKMGDAFLETFTRRIWRRSKRWPKNMPGPPTATCSRTCFA